MFLQRSIQKKKKEKKRKLVHLLNQCFGEGDQKLKITGAPKIRVLIPIQRKHLLAIVVFFFNLSYLKQIYSIETK